MCLAAIAIQPGKRFPLVVLANRDEFHHREAAPLHYWQEERIWAGKDILGHGTWMGLSSTGRFALLTNIRDAKLNRGDNAPSRGRLVLSALRDANWREGLNANLYSGFNLITGFEQGKSFEYWTNSGEEFAPTPIDAGLHVVSNAQLNTPWPKALQLRQGVSDWLKKLDRVSAAVNLDDSIESMFRQEANLFEAMFMLLANRQTAADEDLPSTGVPYEWEKMLSAIHIQSPHYGTRCSSVILVRDDGHFLFEEQSFSPDGSACGTSRITDRIVQTR